MADKIAIIGVGMMGGAIARSLLKGKYQGKITATDAQPSRLREMEQLGIAKAPDNRKAAAESDIIFVCVKPGDVAKILEEMSRDLKGKLVISVAATVPLAYLKKHAPTAKFVRIMPNIAALVQASYTAFSCDANVTTNDKKKVKALLDMMGISEEVDEKYMDAITGLSGSGPGYLSIVVESLMYAGLKAGLPRDIALSSAAQTVLGTGKLVIELKEHPSKIRDMVTTPGGTTIEAIQELEGSQIRQALMKAVEAATKKSQAIRDRLGLN